GLLVAQGRLPDAFVHGLELGRAEHIEAALLSAGDDDPAGEILAELRGEDDTAFVVELRCMRSQQHRPSPPLRPAHSRCAPLYSTPLHFPTTIPYRSGFFPQRDAKTPGITRISGVELSGGKVEDRWGPGGGLCPSHTKKPGCGASGFRVRLR